MILKYVSKCNMTILINRYVFLLNSEDRSEESILTNYHSGASYDHWLRYDAEMNSMICLMRSARQILRIPMLLSAI